MESLYRSYNMEVASAYVIALSKNTVSLDLANRCLASCVQAQMPAQLYEGFDGTTGTVCAPSHLHNAGWYKWLKVTDHHLSSTEVACTLSHIALWVKCMELDRPVVILEHDAVMTQAYLHHQAYNAVVYLGCKEQLTQQSGALVPPLSSINKNWFFINRAHAYAIDPAVAKRLFGIVLERGIFESLDIMIKADDVAIIQTGMFAYDCPGETTITQRKQDII